MNDFAGNDGQGGALRVEKQAAHGNAGHPNVAGIRARAVKRAAGFSKAQMTEMRPDVGPLRWGDASAEVLEADHALLRSKAWSPLPGQVPVPLEALARTGKCRWPIGEVGQPGFGFCGAENHGDHVYCLAHARRAYPSLGHCAPSDRRLRHGTTTVSKVF